MDNKKTYSPAWLELLQHNEASVIYPFLHEVLKEDAIFQLASPPRCTPLALQTFGLALMGEAGEVANVIKKIVRDGHSSDLNAQLGEELVDMMIYMCEVIVDAGIDFDAAWRTKHLELKRRFAQKHGLPDLGYLSHNSSKALVIVGPDNAGKTTIVSDLVTRLPRYTKRIVKPLKRSHAPEEQLLSEMELFFSLLNNEPDTLFIYDREHYPDDIIYAPIVEGHPSILQEMEPSIVRELQHFDVCYLYVTASPQTLVDRLRIRGDDYIDAQMIQEICYSYDRWYESSPLHIAKLDTTNLSSSQAVLEAMRLVDRLLR